MFPPPPQKHNKQPKKMDEHFERMLQPLGGAGGAGGLGKAPAFQPAKGWQGPRPGFVFKRGARGVGYYEDGEEMRKHAKAAEQEGGGGGGKRRRVDEEVRGFVRGVVLVFMCVGARLFGRLFVRLTDWLAVRAVCD